MNNDNLIRFLASYPDKKLDAIMVELRRKEIRLVVNNVSLTKGDAK